MGEHHATKGVGRRRRWRLVCPRRAAWRRSSKSTGTAIPTRRRSGRKPRGRRRSGHQLPVGQGRDVGRKSLVASYWTIIGLGKLGTLSPNTLVLVSSPQHYMTHYCFPPTCPTRPNDPDKKVFGTQPHSHSHDISRYDWDGFGLLSDPTSLMDMISPGTIGTVSASSPTRPL